MGPPEDRGAGLCTVLYGSIPQPDVRRLLKTFEFCVSKTLTFNPIRRDDDLNRPIFCGFFNHQPVTFFSIGTGSHHGKPCNCSKHFVSSYSHGPGWNFSQSINVCHLLESKYLSSHH